MTIRNPNVRRARFFSASNRKHKRVEPAPIYSAEWYRKLHDEIQEMFERS